MRVSLPFVAFGLALLALRAYADPITYSIAVNTASVSGTSGSLDFNFNPGPFATQAAYVQINDFSSDGMPLGSAATIGDVAGTLPGTLTFANDTGFNDYFQDFRYGANVSFDVNLYGPALSAPDGTSTSGSAFTFSMFSDSLGTVPIFTTDQVDGFAYVVNINLDGTTTATDFITSPGSSPVPVSPVPEPGTLALSASGIGFIVIGAMRRKFSSQWRKDAELITSPT